VADFLYTVLSAITGYVGWVLAHFGVPVPGQEKVFHLFAATGAIAGLPLGKFASRRATPLWKALWLPVFGALVSLLTMCSYLFLIHLGPAPASNIITLAGLLMFSFAALSFLISVSGSALADKIPRRRR
jgi:hypothetical protein